MSNSAENKRSNKKIDFMEKVYKYLNGDEKVELADTYLTKNLIDIFKDVELRQSIDEFFANNLNISETSRSTFMHRNTLLYRIDKIQKLTPIEFDIFNLLFQNHGNMVSGARLLKEIWGYEPDDNVETIRVHIRHLRSKIDKISGDKKYIETIYGGGYKLNI